MNLNILIKKINLLKKKNNTNFLDLHSPRFNMNDIKNITECIKSTNVSTNGVFIQKFKSMLKRITKSKYIQLTNSGSSATYVALRALKLEKNDEVFMQSLNYISNPNAVITLGGIPHFIDSEGKNLGIDTIKLSEYIEKKCFFRNKKLFNKKTKRRIKGLINTHIFGNTNNVSQVKIICKKYNLFFIEDASEALGSVYENKHLGTYGDVGLLSFNGNKIITCGAGGAVLTNNFKLFKEISHLSNNAKLNHAWNYEYDNIGYNINMPNLNASLGYSQIQNLKRYIKAKKNLYDFYLNIFKSSKLLSLIKPNINLKPNYWLISALLDKNICNQKNKILRIFNENGIHCRPIWQLLHKMKHLKNFPCMELKNAEVLEKQIISLPSSAHLKT